MKKRFLLPSFFRLQPLERGCGIWKKRIRNRAGSDGHCRRQWVMYLSHEMKHVVKELAVATTTASGTGYISRDEI